MKHDDSANKLTLGKPENTQTINLQPTLVEFDLQVGFDLKILFQTPLIIYIGLALKLRARCEARSALWAPPMTALLHKRPNGVSCVFSQASSPALQCPLTLGGALSDTAAGCRTLALESAGEQDFARELVLLLVSKHTLVVLRALSLSLSL